ncbi:MAG: hypothetical protein GF309_13495 [Candidatus Lokiarchaeota archaeon]|nr:hypothetical protein [Candidatus Lokiarchaeota archaeon]
MSENESGLEIEIERDSDGKRIMVSGIILDDDFSEFDDAYQTLLELWRRAERIDTRFELETEINKAKQATEEFWIEKDGKLVLGADIEEISHKMGLCLLKHYPDCVSQRPIAKEIDCSKGSVGKRVRGDFVGVDQYFYKCETGYQLSDTGLHWVLDEVVPAIVNAKNLQENGE